MKHPVFAFAVMGPLLVGAWMPTVAQAKDKVFFLLPNSTTIRFPSIDGPAFVKAMAEKAPNTEVIVQNAEGDPTRQQRLVEDAIAQGAKAIVFTAAEPNQSAGSLKAAADANVPVILYDHDADGGKAAVHILNNFLTVGEAQGKRAAELIKASSKTPVRIARAEGAEGMFGTIKFGEGQDEFIKPLIASGKAQIVCDQNIQNWDPAIAQNFAEDCLTRTGGKVDMFLTENDGLASGIIAGLVGQGFKPGDVTVTGGQDSTIEGLRFIIEGWQDDTVFKDLRVLAGTAADVVASILNGKGVPAQLINAKVNNKYMDVPAIMLPVSNVTIDNIDEVVKAGVWTWPQICQGIESTKICKANL